MNIRKTYSAVSASVAFALVGATPTASVAATIYACVNNNRSVRDRGGPAQFAATTKQRRLSWAAVGPAGPHGIQGPAGPQGPAGRARDVGSVFPGTPDFYPQGLVGWVAVEHPSLGTYCLTPDPSNHSRQRRLDVDRWEPRSDKPGPGHLDGLLRPYPTQVSGPDGDF